MPDPSLNQGRILVVDDQEANVRLLEAILARAGFQHVHGLTDPRAAVATVGAFEPDLILLDMRMPYLDGLAVLEQLTSRRAVEGFLPVIILTADAEPETRRRALGAGADDFLTKPFDAEEVLLRSRNLLRTRRLYQQLSDQNRDLAGELVNRAGQLQDARAARDLILASLNRLNREASLAETADAICAEFIRSPLIDVVAVIAFEGEDRAAAIAAEGSEAILPLIGVPMPSSRARRLRLRSAGGPWAGPLDLPVEDGRYAERIASAGFQTACYVPLLEHGVLVGMLVAAAREAMSEAETEGWLPAIGDFGAIARVLLGPSLRDHLDEAVARAALETVIDERGFWPVFQPVVDIEGGTVIGYEALTRFADGQRPDLRFAEGVRLGVGVHLEEETLGAALAASRSLPPGAWLSLNVSPALLLDEGRLATLLTDVQRLVVVEITEHVPIVDYDQLRRAINAFGPKVRVAIDDAGAGFASFRHVLELRPDFVKLDAELVRGVEADPSRQALIVGMRHFAQKTGCTLIAEGVETEGERDMLGSLGIRFGQGYLFGRPERVTAPPEGSYAAEQGTVGRLQRSIASDSGG